MQQVYALGNSHFAGAKIRLANIIYMAGSHRDLYNQYLYMTRPHRVQNNTRIGHTASSMHSAACLHIYKTVDNPSWADKVLHAELASSMPGTACNALATVSREKPYMFNCLSSCLPSQLPSPKAALTAALRCTQPTCRREWSWSNARYASWSNAE